MAKELQNLHMTASGAMVAVCWETDQSTPKHARWHVWLEIDTEASKGRAHPLPSLPVVPYVVSSERPGGYGRRYAQQVRKNPPLDEPRNGRKGSWLDATAKANAPMVERALREAERLGLYQQAIDADVAAEAARQDVILQEQADTMLHAAQQLVDEGLPGAERFLGQVRELTRDQQARMLQLITNATHSRKGC